MSSEDESKEVEKKPKSNILIILLVLVVLLGAGGAGVYFMFMKTPSGAGAAVTKEEPVYYPMSTFLVNLADPGSKRFLKVVIELKLSSKEAEEECKEKDVELRDEILTELSSQESDSVVSAEDKVRLKKQLMQSLNHVLTKGKVLEIYFTDFLIQ